MSEDERHKGMRDVVPLAVTSVCRTLRTAGYEAWIVGGAVRDLVLGKTPSDWDVASDALPEAVLKVFPKTIATGLEHGTVTAVVGRGKEREYVEITSFRGEGAYSDSRRPDSVHFGVPLDEDLLRRDFVINAMAYDPIDGIVHDPLGGVLDLEHKVIRAVGVASERFGEDGLRIMRAVRFVSCLGFSLDPDTEAAIPTALVALSKVAQERVRVELLKLLAGKAPAVALDIAMRKGVMAIVLPEVPEDGFRPVMERLLRLRPDAVLRLASLVADVEQSSVESLLRRLTMSNEDRQRVVAMLRHQSIFPVAMRSEVELRKHLSAVGRKAAADHLEIAEAKASWLGQVHLLEGISRAREILASGDALEIRDLALKGKRLMEVTGLRGKAVGEALEGALQHVLATPEDNQSAALEEFARSWAEKNSKKS